MDIRELINLSEELIQKIDASLNGAEISSDDRHRLAAACLDAALEHQKAIVVLIDRNYFGSAFALVRAQFETYARGLWLERCATEKEVKLFKEDKVEKSFKAIIDEVEKCEGYDVGVLSSVRVKSWDAMNSYTHGGYLQAVRRIGPEYIEGNYTLPEIEEAINFANSIGMLAALEISFMTKNKDLIVTVSNLINTYGKG